jgi:hypothetical protein
MQHTNYSSLRLCSSGGGGESLLLDRYQDFVYHAELGTALLTIALSQALC